MVEVSDDRFAELVEDAFRAVPPELAALLDNVALFIEDDPPADDPDLLGYYDGVALTERDTSYGGSLPDRIVVFRNPTLAICDTEDDVVARGRHHRRARDRPPLRHRRRPSARARVRLMDVQRSADRFVTETDDVTTRHSFSYGAHYDPDNIAFGPIIAINEESLLPGAGYDLHHHADVEIVTWVLDGALAHEDTTGPPRHHRARHRAAAERRHRRPARRAQRVAHRTAALRPDDAGVRPRRRAGVRKRRGRSRAGDADADRAGARAGRALRACTSTPARPSPFPAAPRSLVHVTRGTIQLAGETLEAGDQARTSDGAAYDLSASGPADALIWQLQR